MNSMEVNGSRLPLDMNHASVNVTRFEDQSWMGETSVMCDSGQMPPVNFHDLSEGRKSPASGRNIKDFATQISELKKQNFSLKLRIFYMEERMQEQFNGRYEDVYRENIELKVECDGLRKELRDKHDLLVRASNAVACMESDPEELRQARELAQKELKQVKDTMNERVQEAEKELQSVQTEANDLTANLQRLQDYAHKVERDNETLKADLKKSNGEIIRIQQLLLNNKEESQLKDENLTSSRGLELLSKDLQKKEKLVAQLKETLEAKQTLVEALADEKKFEEENLRKSEGIVRNLERKNKELEDDLTKMKQQEERLRTEYMQHIAEQQQRLDEYELAARQVSEELEKREEEVKDLSEALRDAEATGKELADNYNRAITENKAGTRELLMRDKAIKGLTEVVQRKDKEIVGLKGAAAQSESCLEDHTNAIRDLTAKEEALGVKVQRLAKLEKEVTQLKELNHNLNSRNQELEDADENVRSMDERLREKDKELQGLLTKYKALLKQSQENEAAKIEASMEREDMAQRFEKEKKEFSEVLRSMKRQFDESPKDSCKKEVSQEILTLQQQLQNVKTHLKLKQSQLEEATGLFKKAESERKAAFEELEDAMRRREDELAREAESRNRIDAAKSAEIERLMEGNRAKDDKIDILEGDVLQLDRAAHEAGDKAVVSSREAARWKDDSARKGVTIIELTQNLEALKNDTVSSENNQILRLTRENVKLKELLKDREVQFLQNRITVDESLTVRSPRSKTGKESSAMNLALDALRSEVANYKRELDDAKGTVARLTSELGNGREQVLALRQACNAKDRVIENLKASEHYPVVDSEGGLSMATENDECSPSSHCAFRHQRFSKRRSKPCRHESDSSAQSSFSDSAMQSGDERFGKQLRRRNDFTFAPMIKTELRNEIRDLQTEIDDIKGAQRNEKDLQQGLIRKLEQRSNHLRQLADILTEEQKIYRKQLNLPVGLPQNAQSASEDHCNVAGSQHAMLDWMLRQVEGIRTKLCALLLEVSEPKGDASQMPVREGSDCAFSEEGEDAELQTELDKTREELGDAVYSLTHLQARATSDIQLLKQQLEGKRQEVAGLMIQLDRARSESAIRDAEMSTLRIEVDKLNTLQMKVGKDSDANIRAIMSGNESDGTRSLSRKELRQLVSNLKNKLENAEKLNEILGDQVESATDRKRKQSPTIGLNSALSLTKDVERLKEQGKTGSGQHRRQRSQEVPYRRPSHKSPPRSLSAGGRLPVCVEQAYSEVDERQDYARGKARCLRLQNKLAAAEETVRQQAEKLKNLQEHRARIMRKDAAVEMRMQSSADDTGYASVSPKIEQKYNSLIQAQAKELSMVRRQMRKGREACKDLGNEYDILRRYVTTLLGVTQYKADAMLATGVTNKLDTCRLLTKRLKQHLSEWSDVGSIASDTDDSASSRSISSIRHGASRTLQQRRDIEEKSDRIRELDERLTGVTNLRRESGPHKNRRIVSDSLGFLTPDSSSHSLYTYTDEERTGSTKRPTIGQDYVPFPGCRPPVPCDETPKRSPRQSKTLPMYQRTTAVTEYLPPGNADGSAGDLPGRRKLSTNGDAENCVASFGGSWCDALSPRSQLESIPRPIAHSSPMPRGGPDGARRLKRTSEYDSECNDSLREELGLTTPGREQAKDASNDNPADILNEIRTLRQQLEDSIEVNHKLREELEKKLERPDEESTPVFTNIYLPADPCDNRAHLDDVEGLRRDLVRANEEVGELQKQLEEGIKMENNFADVSQELDRLRVRLAESSTQTEILGRFIDDQKKLIQSKDAEIEALHESLVQAKSDLKEAKDENAADKLGMETLREKSDAATESAQRMGENLNRVLEELEQSHHIVISLKSELALHEKIGKTKDSSNKKSADKDSAWSFDVAQFLAEMKGLRVQLERSIGANGALRKELQRRLARDRENGSVLSPGRITTINIHHAPMPQSAGRDRDDAGESSGDGRARQKQRMASADSSPTLFLTPPSSASSTDKDTPRLPSGSTIVKRPREKMRNWPHYNLHGPYAIGKLTDYDELKQVVADGRLLVRSIEQLESTSVTARASSSQYASPRTSKDLEANLRLLHRMLEDCGRILKLFWPASVPPPPIQLTPSQGPKRPFQKCASRLSDASSDVSKCTKDAGFGSDSSINSEAVGLRREVGKLSKRLSDQDKLLKNTVDRLHNANQMKEGIEHAILKQLTVTHDVLKKARGNLEVKAGETHANDCHPSST